MLSNSEIRRQGNQNLKGNYLTAIGNFVIIAIISSIIQSIFSPGTDYTLTDPTAMMPTEGEFVLTFTESLISSFVVSFLSLGLHWGFLDIQDGDPLTVGHLFVPFKTEPLKVVGYLLRKQILIMLWSLLLIVPGIIKSYAWAMADYIYYDEPTLDNREILAKSDALMQGNKWRLFRMELYYTFLYFVPFLVWLGGLLFFGISAFQNADSVSNFAVLWLLGGLLLTGIVTLVLAAVLEPRRNSARAAFYTQL